MYIVKKIDNENEKVWDYICGVKIDNFPWDKTGYKPITEVKMYYTDEYMKIRFKSEEKSIKVRHTKLNESVYKDSCVEFFFNPEPGKSNMYFNFEMNAAGVLLLQLDDKTRERKFLNNINLDIFEIKTDVTMVNKEKFNDFKPWSVEYKIPFSFIKQYFKEFKIKTGYVMKGNFFKCGDETDTPHYGCWNEIIKEVPSFHQPQFFEKIIFE